MSTKWAIMASCCSRHRILLLLITLVLAWISLQLRSSDRDSFDGSDYTVVESSVVSLTKDKTEAEFSLLLPAPPDTSLVPRLREIIPDHSESPFRDCPATAQVKLTVDSHDNRKWMLQTLDQEGNPKGIGGDEFYVSFRDHRNRDVSPEERMHPSAVANILDRHDGTYELEFVAPPLTSLDPQSRRNAGGGGNLTIHFQYTCGIGYMAPPSKDSWVHGGAMHKSVTIFMPHIPMIRPFQPPLSEAGILSKYEQVLVFGDSAMKQFVKNASRAYEPNIVFRVKRRKPWTMALIEEHLSVLRKQFGRDLDATNTKSSHSTALILGSAIWDVLASPQEHTATRHLLASANHASENVFQDHLNACRHFINTVRQQYPNLHVLWKSPTAMHIHVVDPSNPVNAAKNHGDDNGSSSTVPSLLQRVRYMSSSRMAYLCQLQRQLMRELHVPFLDIYEATYLSASWTFSGDGRHYSPELHQHMLRWFY